MLYGNWVWRGSCEKSSESVTWRVFDMMCAAQVEVVRMKRFGPGTVASRQKRRTLERFVPPVGFRWNLEGWRFLFPSAVSLSARRSRRTKYLLWTCLVACERRSEALSAAQNQQSFGCSYRRGWCTVEQTQGHKQPPSEGFQNKKSERRLRRERAGRHFASVGARGGGAERGAEALMSYDRLSEARHRAERWEALWWRRRRLIQSEWGLLLSMNM